MRSFSFRSLLLLLLWGAASALAACGHDGGPDEHQDPPAIPVIDSAKVLAFAGTTNQQMQGIIHGVFSGQDLATPNPFDLPATAAARSGPSLAPAAAIAACAPVQTGVDSEGIAIDSDRDGIPDDNTVDFGPGCSFLDGGIEYTWSGKYRLRDAETGLKDWEYVTTALAAKARDTLTGNFVRQEVTGTESAHFTGAHAAHLMDVTEEVSSRSGSDSTHYSLRTLTASTYDPGAGPGFVLGGTLPQGTFGFAAQLTFRDLAAGGDSLRFVITTPTPIHISFDCGSGIDAGQLLGLYEGDARVGFRTAWPVCGTRTVELFGTTP